MVECYLYFNEHTEDAKALFECLRAIRSPKLRLLLSDNVYNNWFQNRFGGVCALDVIKASDKKGEYCICYSWDVNNPQINPLYTEDIRGLVNIMSANSDIVFCIYDHASYPKDTLTIFRDIINIPEYPDAFYKLKSFSNIGSILSYFKANDIVPSFSLEGNDEFEITTIPPVQGASVYRQKRTGFLWYLDNLHKTHFEVFELQGKKHIGEATIDGELDRSKKDSTKRPIVP